HAVAVRQLTLAHAGHIVMGDVLAVGAGNGVERERRSAPERLALAVVVDHAGQQRPAAALDQGAVADVALAVGAERRHALGPRRLELDAPAASAIVRVSKSARGMQWIAPMTTRTTLFFASRSAQWACR